MVASFETLLAEGWAFFKACVIYGSMVYHLLSRPSQYLPKRLLFSLPLFLSFYICLVGVLILHSLEDLNPFINVNALSCFLLRLHIEIGAYHTCKSLWLFNIIIKCKHKKLLDTFIVPLTDPSNYLWELGPFSKGIFLIWAHRRWKILLCESPITFGIGEIVHRMIQ